MRSVIYSLMAEYWPTADADPSALVHIAEFARIWREMPKVVFSNTLETVEWNARLAGDIAGEVAELRAQPGKNWGSVVRPSPRPSCSSA